MSFAEADRIVEAVRRGANLREACEKTGFAYGTVRKWISAGRRDPSTAYGAWVRRLDAAKAGGAKNSGHVSGIPNDSEPGPVESRVDALLHGRDLHGEAALAAAQARTLARAIDELGVTPGGAAKTALASCSRRLEELLPKLQIPREDAVDQLHRQRSQRRRGPMKPGVGWTSHAEAAERLAEAGERDASNGSGEVKIEGEGERL